jgi:hypothetical protein
MKIGSYDPRSLPRYDTNRSRPVAGKTITASQAATPPDEVSISAAGRDLAAAGGLDRGQKAGGETKRPDRMERAERRKDSGYYDRPDVKREIARRIADEIVKDSSADKENG